MTSRIRFNGKKYSIHPCGAFLSRDSTERQGERHENVSEVDRGVERK